MGNVTKRWRGVRMTALPQHLFEDRSLLAEDLGVLCWLWGVEGDRTDVSAKAIERRFVLAPGMGGVVLARLQRAGHVVITGDRLDLLEAPRP
jgi:hypothetical protein